jgi:hypothetical protein
MKRNSTLTIKIGSLLASSLLFASFLTNASIVKIAPGNSELNILTPPKYTFDNNFNYSSYKDYQSILKDLYLQYANLYSTSGGYYFGDDGTL